MKEKYLKSVKFFLILALLAFYPVNEVFSATLTIYVNQSGAPLYPYDTPATGFPTIQAAVNAIANVNGGGPPDLDLVTQGNDFIILIQTGDYTETVEVGDYITSPKTVNVENKKT